ncbi:MAG: FHA domain-containing protein [Rhodospirillales bacterium]
MIWRRFLIAMAIAVLAIGPVRAQQSGLTATNGAASIDVIRASDNRLRIDIKISGGAKLNEVKASLAAVELPQLLLLSYPMADDTSSVLFLIDTSTALRQPAIERVIASITEMLRAAKPYQRFGLATFDSDLAIKVPPGSDAATVLAALPQIRATGMTTELYRSLMSAITQLAVSPASRRAIFLFSDGLSDDTAYKFEDAVAAGRANDMAIYTFGFARTPAQTAALKSLQRLSEDTGGKFYAADDKFGLPPAALGEPFDSLDSGGRVYFQLTPEQFAAGGVVNVQVNISNGGASLDVVLPGLPPPPERGWQLWIKQPTNQVIVGLVGVFVLGAIAMLIDLQRRGRRRYLKRLADGHFDEPEAWLEHLQGDGTHIGVTGTLFRIGRNRDNDLVLANASVAAHHAVIHRSSDGSFSVADLRSGKGLFVNLTQVQTAPLHNGDIVELGRLRFRFRATGRGLPEHVVG